MTRASDTKSQTAATRRKGGAPPEASRWTKGCTSPNPAGRPKKGQDLRSLVGRELDSSVEANEGGRIISLTKREVVAKQLVKKAMQGDMKAIDRVMEYDREAVSTETSNLERMAADQKLSEAVLAAMPPPPPRQDIAPEPSTPDEVEDGQLMLPLFDL